MIFENFLERQNFNSSTNQTTSIVFFIREEKLLGEPLCETNILGAQNISCWGAWLENLGKGFSTIGCFHLIMIEPFLAPCTETLSVHNLFSLINQPLSENAIPCGVVSI